MDKASRRVWMIRSKVKNPTANLHSRRQGSGLPRTGACDSTCCHLCDALTNGLIEAWNCLCHPVLHQAMEGRNVVEHSKSTRHKNLDMLKHLSYQAYGVSSQLIGNSHGDPMIGSSISAMVDPASTSQDVLCAEVRFERCFDWIKLHHDRYR